MLGRRLDPEVHRVHADDALRGYLVEHAELERGVHVTEEDDVCLSIRVGQAGLELLEHIEVGEERLAAVEVVAILAAPAKGLAASVLDALEVNPPALKHPHVLLVEVLADNGDEVDVGEIGGGDSEVGEGAADNIVGLTEGRLDGVESDGADGDDGHVSGVERREVRG